MVYTSLLLMVILIWIGEKSEMFAESIDHSALFSVLILTEHPAVRKLLDRNKFQRDLQMKPFTLELADSRLEVRIIRM